MCPSSKMRAQGRPDASRTRSLVCEVDSAKSTRANHRYAETFRPSLRNGVTAYTRSPRCTGLSSHRRRAGFRRHDLIPASGDQDHTTLPSAASIIRQTDVAASIASRFHVRDDAYAPLAEAGRRDRSIYFRKTEGEYFSRMGLTRIRKIRSSGKSLGPKPSSRREISCLRTACAARQVQDLGAAYRVNVVCPPLGMSESRILDPPGPTMTPQRTLGLWSGSAKMILVQSRNARRHRYPPEHGRSSFVMAS
jgi:hypothetical protein